MQQAVHSGKTDGKAGIGRLRLLAEEMMHIASELEGTGPAAKRLLLLDGHADPEAENTSPGAIAQPALTALAHAIYGLRRRRAALFGNANLFGEPAWDMLLDLYIAEQEGKRLPVTSACIGAAVPTTTGLRWLSILENQGLVVREDDPADARRTYVRISSGAQAEMNRLLAQFAETLGDEAGLR